MNLVAHAGGEVRCRRSFFVFSGYYSMKSLFVNIFFEHFCKVSSYGAKMGSSGGAIVNSTSAAP